MAGVLEQASDAVAAAPVRRRLRLTGGVSERWQALATQVRRAVAADFDCDLTPVADPDPAAGRLLIFIEHPALSLASLATAGHLQPSAPLLEQWCRQARGWLDQAQAAGQRPLLIDLDEAASQPQAFAATLSGWLGVDVELPVDAAAVAMPEALLLWLAQAWCTRDRRVLSLHEELLACSTPLAESPVPGEAAGFGLDSWAQTDFAESLLRLEALFETERRFKLESAERTPLLLSLHQTQLSLEHTSQQRLQLEAEANTLRPQWLQQQAEHTLLHTQLHLMQGELQSLLVDRDGLNSVLAQARADHAAAEKVHLGARAELQALIASREEALAQAQAQLRARQTLDHDVLAQALRDREQVAAQLYQALGQASQGHAEAPPPVSPLQALAESVEVAHVRDEPPHRELSLVASQVMLGSRCLPQLQFRLVEHQGRPGLCLLASADGVQALSQWQAHGQDGDGPFMLLVPADTQGRDALQRLGSADWLAVQALSELAVLACSAGSAGLQPHWAVVASRLQAQLRDLPPRLRYDSLALQAVAAQSYSLQLNAACFGHTPLADTQLLWRPAHAEPLVWSLCAAATAAAPVASWPTQADGLLAAQWSLAPALGGSLRARAGWWQQRSANERLLLLGLLDALAAAAQLAAERQDPGASALQQSAAHLRKTAHQALRWGRLRSMLAPRR